MHPQIFRHNTYEYQLYPVSCSLGSANFLNHIGLYAFTVVIVFSSAGNARTARSLLIEAGELNSFPFRTSAQSSSYTGRSGLCRAVFRVIRLMMQPVPCGMKC